MERRSGVRRQAGARSTFVWRAGRGFARGEQERTNIYSTTAMTALRRAVLLSAALAPAPLAAAPPPVVWDQPFTAEAAGEAVAAVTAACDGCSWERRGREAAVLRLELDGRYSQHLVLARGAAPAAYRVLLGPLAAGAHRLQITRDPSSARHAGAVVVASADVRVVPPGDPGHDALAHAPFVYARPGTMARFSDVPLLAWYETGDGGRLRYSIVFSNEDGGTPPDRLLATWGRLTDIEYVYGVTLGPDGRAGAEELQGRDHRLLPFAGRREGAHPLLWVVTDNNMVGDRGRTAERFAPAPDRFDLAGVSREVVMDAAPWSYRVSAQEARREGRVREPAGDKRIVDPRRYVTLEACAPAEDATVAFEVGVGRAGEPLRFFASDAGRPQFRIARNPTHFPTGCFRGAVALPADAGDAPVRALRVRAFTRLPRKHEPPLPPGAGRARLTSVNTLFRLTPLDEPGPSLLRWRGDAPLVPGGPPFEIAIAGEEAR